MEHLGLAPSADAALAVLPAPLASWFRHHIGGPTLIQRLAWPPLAAGRNVLISAPTGSGKTLAAFLPLLGRFLARDSGSVWNVASSLIGLIVTPLKALGYDAGRNLQRHLEQIASFLPAETRLPRVAVRTGDTPAEERRALRDHPPDILLTTPESLAVLLSQPSLSPLFSDLRWVVIDEIHALAASKRGADLSLSLERISAASAEAPQRVGLSATAVPLVEAARFLVGADRSCTITRAEECSPLELTISPLPGSQSFVQDLLAQLEPLVCSRRTTLIFTNTRALAERLAWALRRRLPAWDAQIAVHHSSLAAARRRAIEERMKQGDLRVVVSSTSLELGIDIGAIDLVVLVHPPGDVVRLLQRLGRSGHGPGRIRRGLVLTANPAELLEAAVTAASGRADQCEPLRIPNAPLDVLCQQILGMACVREWCAEEMFAIVRRAAPYLDLARQDFDDCVAYLLGLDHRGEAWLPARLRGHEGQFTIAGSRMARLLRRNLGTIIEEEPVLVALVNTTPIREAEEVPSEPEVIGQLDPLFAERLQPGDRFLLDGRCLEFRRREEGKALVEEVAGRPQVPRWGSDGWPLSSELAHRLFLLRVQAAEALREGAPALTKLLRRDFRLEGRAAAVLVDYFQRQEAVSEIPDASGWLIEAVSKSQGEEYYIHTPLNRLGNDALARVAVHRLARDHGRSALPIIADLGFALLVRGFLPAKTGISEMLRLLLAEERFEADLNGLLAGSDTLRERFQRVAQSGLMLLRHPLGRRRSVGGRTWGERQLFEQVRAHNAGFVLLRQALQEVRAGWCDVRAALALVRRLPGQTIRCRWLSRPSPFVESWTQPLVGESEALSTPAEALQRLHAELLGVGLEE